MKKKIGPISKVLKTTIELWKSEAIMLSSEVQIAEPEPEFTTDKNTWIQYRQRCGLEGGLYFVSDGEVI